MTDFLNALAVYLWTAHIATCGAFLFTIVAAPWRPGLSGHLFAVLFFGCALAMASLIYGAGANPTPLVSDRIAQCLFGAAGLALNLRHLWQMAADVRDKWHHGIVYEAVVSIAEEERKRGEA